MVKDGPCGDTLRLTHKHRQVNVIVGQSLSLEADGVVCLGVSSTLHMVPGIRALISEEQFSVVFQQLLDVHLIFQVATWVVLSLLVCDCFDTLDLLFANSSSLELFGYLSGVEDHLRVELVHQLGSFDKCEVCPNIECGSAAQEIEGLLLVLRHADLFSLAQNDPSLEGDAIRSNTICELSVAYQSNNMGGQVKLKGGILVTGDNNIGGAWIIFRENSSKNIANSSLAEFYH